MGNGAPQRVERWKHVKMPSRMTWNSGLIILWKWQSGQAKMVSDTPAWDAVPAICAGTHHLHTVCNPSKSLKTIEKRVVHLPDRNTG
jgi:hypothetical protein